MKKIYFDYAASTPVDKKVLKAMKPYFYDVYGNSSATHWFGQKALEGVDMARNIIAEFLHTKPANILFTSGATESNNMVLQNILNFVKEGVNIIISEIEHPSIIETAKYLSNKGVEVKYLPVDSAGKVILDKLEDLVDLNTVLVSVMYVNNETGVKQPIKEIGDYLSKANKDRTRKILFHTDAVQAITEFSCNMDELPVDFISLSAHKIYGPKGVGCLYVRDMSSINQMMFGGHQEKNKRAGTTNVAGIVGFGRAVELLQLNFDKNLLKFKELNDYFVELIKQSHLNIKINSNGVKSNKIVNICIKNNSTEDILIKLDQNGFAASASSACNSGAIGDSHVLKAMKMNKEDINSSIRLSFGSKTSKKQIKKILELISRITK